MAVQITELPEPPSTASPSTFPALADAFLGAFPTFREELNELASEAEENAGSAAASAIVAAAVSGFRGAWSALTGSASVPYSVYHSGRYWMLLSNIADITVKVPGVASEWAELRRGTTAWQRKTTTYTAVEGDRLICDTSGGAFTVTLPANPLAGDEVTFTDGGFSATVLGWGANALTIARNGQTIMGLAENLTCNTRGRSFKLVFINSDWRVVLL